MTKLSDSTPATGQWIRLEAFLRTNGLWLGPGWAAVCGVIASGRFTWSARGLLLAGLAIFLVDGVWATLWSAAIETNWAAIAARWNASPPPLRPRALLHMRTGAPSDRATRWLSQLTHWWQTELQPVAGSTVSSIVVCLALGLVLAAILGGQMLMLSAAALALIQIGLVINRAAGQPLPVIQAILEVGLAWLAGHAAFAPINIISTLMAAVFAITYAGGLQLVEQQGGLKRWRWSQLAAAAIVLIARHPLPALMLFLTTFAQLLIEPGLKERSGAWFVRSSQVWLMAAMLITAFTIR